MKYLFLLMIVLLTNTSVHAQTMAEMADSTCNEYLKVDKRLNRIYNRILKEYAGDTAFIRKLRISERIWVAYREAQVQMVYSDPTTYGSGNALNMCECELRQELTEDRIKWLQQWTIGISDEYFCGGSMKRKEGK